MSFVEKQQRRVEIAKDLAKFDKQVRKFQEEAPDLVQEWLGQFTTAGKHVASLPEGKTVQGAILDFLKSHGPATASEIQERVAFRTTSRDPNHVIHQTLGRLRKSGLIKDRGTNKAGHLVFTL